MGAVVGAGRGHQRRRACGRRAGRSTSSPVAKLLPLLLLVVLGAAADRRRRSWPRRPWRRPDWTQAVLLLVFAYGGFEAPLIPAGEARDPRRDSAFALLTALAVIAIVYCAGAAGGGRPGAGVADGGAGAGAGGGRLRRAARRARRGVRERGRHGLDLRLDGGHRRCQRRASSTRWPSAASCPRCSPASTRASAPRTSPSRVRAAGLAFGALRRLRLANATISAIVRLVTYGLVCVALLVFRRRGGLEAPGFRVPGGAVGRGAGRHRLLPVAARHAHLHPGLGCWRRWSSAGAAAMLAGAPPAFDLRPRGRKWLRVAPRSSGTSRPTSAASCASRAGSARPARPVALARVERRFGRRLPGAARADRSSCWRAEGPRPRGRPPGPRRARRATASSSS